MFIVLQVNIMVPISYLLFWAVLLCFSLYSEPVVCGLGMVIMLTGVPVFFIGVQWKDKPKWVYVLVGEFIRTLFTAHTVLTRVKCFRWSLRLWPVCLCLQRKPRTWARSCSTLCFHRKTPRRPNPSLPKSSEVDQGFLSCIDTCTSSFCLKSFFFFTLFSQWILKKSVQTYCCTGAAHTGLEWSRKNVTFEMNMQVFSCTLPCLFYFLLL